ncbi:MAG TPA: hypothetical protein PKI32_01020 [Opitutales bacterium]|nr:hypothetical protein [Opitutales bacterium]
MTQARQETITFKADTELAKLLSAMPNRSEFIRGAILNALDNTCPLCMGTGIITPQQKTHWDAFMSHHHIEKCGDCDAVHIVCDKDAAESPAS